MSLDKNEIEKKMKFTVENFLNELSGIRTGRASTKILDSLKVNSYGSDMPIDQLGTVSVQDSRLLTVQVWDKSQIQNVEKSIRESGLGLNPNVDGQLIRIPIPELNEERRTELTKIIGKYAEQARIAIRNIRREGMEQLKKLEKSGEISQDEHKRSSSEIQMLTDNKINDIDTAQEKKSEEVMQV
ncbi:MAG: ribosome recycling factor [Rhodospirillaceae bacterium]|nr:ribosome recycling factor [Rhodospirillaceae bacterium]|tara:strand:+ start:5231 stop:5785 length:555 start_codon:yes stop_codon:yes gene_type:complete